MPNMIQNLGLDFLTEDEKTLDGFICYLIQNGKILPSYSGAPYIFSATGTSEFWLRTQIDEENGLRVVGFDSHGGGLCVWKMGAMDIEADVKNEPMSKLMLFRDYESGAGMVPIYIMNPDVLPGPLEGDAKYYTDTSGKTVTGSQEIIERINRVHDAQKDKYMAHMAIISEVDDGEKQKYPVGTRCVVLAYEKADNYESIVFLDCNEDGMITGINVSQDAGYHFMIDGKPAYKTPFDEMDFPETVAEQILVRAKFENLINREMELEEVFSQMEDYDIFESNAKQMLEALDNNPQPDNETALKNLFGYLFAKTMEKEINIKEAESSRETMLLAHYSPVDAFAGRLNSSLSNEKNSMLEKMMEKGKMFFNDYQFFKECRQLTETEINGTIMNALIAVQRIAQLYVSRDWE